MIKRCKHEKLIFIKNVHGDRINDLNCRSLWKCNKCGKIVKNQNLVHFIVPDNDLEAKTIQAILKQSNIDFCITQQQWGASWEGLEDEIKTVIKNRGIIYGIELSGNKPSNCYNIDHHGDLAGKMPSSLEQAANIINYKLTDEQMLIARNDSAYFEGMLEYMLHDCKLDFHTAKNKCMKIRALDWKAQGITFLEKREALLSVNNKELKNNKYIIRCSHSKTAPIMDSLFWDDKEYIIISDDGEINIDCAAETINKLNEKFPDSWYGGRLQFGKGYWGTTSYNQTEVLDYFINL